MSPQTLLQLIDTWGQHWQAQPISVHCVSVLAGLCGAGAFGAVTKQYILLPQYCRRAHRLDMGFGGTLVVGITVAVAADHSFPVGFVAALFAPTVLTLTNKVILPGLAAIVLLWAKSKVDAQPTEPEEETDERDNP